MVAPRLPHGVPIDQAYAERDAKEWKARALRAEFCLAIMAECVGRRFMEINFALWPGPVKHPDGYWVDGTDAVRAVRHDIIRKLFHEDP